MCPVDWLVPSQKMVRHFHTSPHAVRAFLHKAALNGFVAQVREACCHVESMAVDVVGFVRSGVIGVPVSMLPPVFCYCLCIADRGGSRLLSPLLTCVIVE